LLSGISIPTIRATEHSFHERRTGYPLALPLLVFRVLADHAEDSLPTDDLAVWANLLD
jgi:hypothetical protein